jgi:hypothetical protein
MSLTLLFIVLVFLRTETLEISQNQFEGYVLIGNNTGVSEIDSRAVIAVFRGQRRIWENGISVTVVLPSLRSSEAEEFSRMVYNSTTSGVQRYWFGLVFQGRANPPVFLESYAEIIQYIERNPGAIALVPSVYRAVLNENLIIRTQ